MMGHRIRTYYGWVCKNKSNVYCVYYKEKYNSNEFLITNNSGIEIIFSDENKLRRRYK